MSQSNDDTPVSQEKLPDLKRRKVALIADPDDPEPQDPIPHKSPSPTLNPQTKRVPSLKLVHKPELSPPASPKESEVHHPSVKAKSDLEEEPLKSDQHKEQPVQVPLSANQIRKKELKLDIELRNVKLQLENVKRAQGILDKNDNEKIDQLIIKWRDAAQKASNYLLNAAIDKVSKSGGMKEFSRREKDKLRETIEFTIDNSFQDRVFEITESDQYKALSEKEKENILEDLEKQQELALEEAEKSFLQSEGNEEPDEFTMKDLYKRLKLNYKLVYPDEE